MPLSRLTDEQILGLLEAKPTIEGVPGVKLFRVALLGPTRSDPAVVVLLDERKRGEIGRLPPSVAGVPVVVRLEDRSTMRVIETIDPRNHGGVWPRPGRADR